MYEGIRLPNVAMYGTESYRLTAFRGDLMRAFTALEAIEATLEASEAEAGAPMKRLRAARSHASGALGSMVALYRDLDIEIPSER
jgi:hypothetical protein